MKGNIYHAVPINEVLDSLKGFETEEDLVKLVKSRQKK